MANLKEQIAYLELECELNEQTFNYIKREFGEKSAMLLGDKFHKNARLFKAILASLRELQNIKPLKQ
ncbi:hypothetical protein [Nafulsella turpanensis]|uniref:hypothetical protein n=1 Tax=Nafulsella turpanensis TaxID=1265690 RepID=UPI00034B7E77|nr:hypothetical protein [Nafulsella turpanensis]